MSKSKNSSYKIGINKFSDLTQQEFQKKYLNLNYDAMAVAYFDPFHIKIKNAAPDSLDWRNLNRVSVVKDQGGCSAPWAFSTVGNLEAFMLVIMEYF